MFMLTVDKDDGSCVCIYIHVCMCDRMVSICLFIYFFYHGSYNSVILDTRFINIYLLKHTRNTTLYIHEYVIYLFT